jgi:tyrosyl-tRNA synthetase
LAQTGIASSGKEAKRLIAEGGLRLNNEPVSDPQLTVDAGLIGDGLKVSVGKKKHRMVQLG